MYQCMHCNTPKDITHFEQVNNRPILAICNECLDTHYIQQVDCTCSVCKRKLPANYFQHYRRRFKKNGMRLRVNTNCKDCSIKESAVLIKLKKDNPPPPYLTPCPQCKKICYEKVEDIPAGVNGTNGPWQCDHDHTTKQFRGWLCKRCNTGTGLIGDTVEYFTNALKNKKVR